MQGGGRIGLLASQWLAKEIVAIGAVAYTHDEFRRCMSFISVARVRVAPLHTRTVGLSELDDALRQPATGDSADVKVLVDPRR